MSFGFGVGDFITVLQLAQKVWKDFSEAPSQYQAIALEVENVCHVLQEISEYVEENDISDTQHAKLHDIVAGVSKVLNDTEKSISKRSSLVSNQAGLKGRAKRIWARVTFEPEEISDLRQRIISSLTVLDAFVSGFSRKNIAKLVNNQNQQEFISLLDWLAPRDYAAQHSSHLDRCLAKTGQWMLDSSDFKIWLDHDDCKGLLLQGIPGTGKTILTAIIINHLYNLYNANKAVGICYYYCDYKRQSVNEEIDDSRKEGHDLPQVLLRLLRQLAESSLRPSIDIQKLYDAYQKFSNKVMLEDVRTVFYAYAKSFDRIYVLVDALDECETVNGCRRALLAELFELSNTCGVHVIVTSRPLLDVSNTLHGFKTVEIKASDEDIGKYVEYNISKLPNFVVKDIELQEDIKNAIATSADGIFLLATLHVQSLKGKRSPGALRKALKSFGKGNSAYAEAYDKTMKRIVGQIEDQKELAIETLMWTVYAQRPLKTAELLHALATDIDKSSFDFDDIPDIEDVLSACCGLVIVEQESGIVRLVHRTAQEFFQDSDCTWLVGAHTRLSKTCITYLSFKDLGNGRSRFTDKVYKDQLAQYPLWDYASWYWQYHVELQEVPMSITEFAAKQEQVEASSQALMEHTVPHYLELCRQHPGITGLHLLARCGLTSLIPSFLHNHDINARDRYQQSPISYALQEGHIDTISLLIKAGACLDGLYKLKGKSILFFDHEVLDEESPNGHAQHLLLWSMNNMTHLTKLLINGGAQLDIVDARGRNPLHWAIKIVDPALLHLLLQKGSDPNSTDMSGRSPLFYALQWQFVLGIELLLEKDPNLSIHNSVLIDIAEGIKNETFQAAAWGKMVPIVSWLLKHGAQINYTDRNGETALMHAIRSKDMTEFLLSKGADANLVNAAGCTALIRAIDRGDIQTVVLLLNSGAGVNIGGDEGGTALMHAARMGKEITQLLLKNGADIHATCAMGMTALLYAARYGRKDVVTLLLENGSNVNEADSSGRTALVHATATVKMDVMTLLIKAGANVPSSVRSTISQWTQ